MRTMGRAGMLAVALALMSAPLAAGAIEQAGEPVGAPSETKTINVRDSARVTDSVIFRQVIADAFTLQLAPVDGVLASHVLPAAFTLAQAPATVLLSVNRFTRPPSTSAVSNAFNSTNANSVSSVLADRPFYVYVNSGHNLGHRTRWLSSRNKIRHLSAVRAARAGHDSGYVVPTRI